jgi:tRNA1Val (adenine37-N6)-methyltransferase
MKVGTDGVLLGAWADISNAQRILDVGCGSGLIALMLAQRSQVRIDAIDLDENAYRQTIRNIELSPFHQQVKAIQGDFLDYHPNYHYDLIVSNPPFFVDSLKPPDGQRALARHTDDLPFDRLMEHSSKQLSDRGRLSLIFPVSEWDVIQSAAESYGLCLRRKTVVRPIENRPPKRILVEYSKHKGNVSENELVIEQAPKIYSEEFIALMEDYYLKI